MGVYEPPPPPDRLSSTELRYGHVSNIEPVSYSSANPSQPLTGLRVNIDEVAHPEDGGFAGFSTPSSQRHVAQLDPSLHDSGHNDSGQHESWGFPNFDTQMPAWFAGDDFDLTALNSEILVSTANWFPQENANQYQHEYDPVGQTSRSLVEDMLPSREETVQTHWYTFMGTSRNGHITPEVRPDETQVDDAYRASLAAKLQPHIPVLPLPSTDFLNLCIHMYFTKFHPIFHIVHAPTFRPSSKSSLLLLSICSIGSLFMGSSQAASQGLKIFETLNKAILSSWEKYFSAQRSETIAMIQAALIGQTFGLLSGGQRQKDLLTAQTFHGTLVVWAKRATTSKLKRASDYVSLDEITHTPEKAWEKWVEAEEQNRLIAGIHVHDVEISEL
ncbi:hypothetical protein LTR66_017479, partial [Elasticomyces elasticus]